MTLLLLRMGVPFVVDIRVDCQSCRVGLPKDCSPHQQRSNLREGDEEQLHFMPMLPSSMREVLLDCRGPHGYSLCAHLDNLRKVLLQWQCSRSIDLTAEMNDLL